MGQSRRSGGGPDLPEAALLRGAASGRSGPVVRSRQGPPPRHGPEAAMGIGAPYPVPWMPPARFQATIPHAMTGPPGPQERGAKADAPRGPPPIRHGTAEGGQRCAGPPERTHVPHYDTRCLRPPRRGQVPGGNSAILVRARPSPFTRAPQDRGCPVPTSALPRRARGVAGAMGAASQVPPSRYTSCRAGRAAGIGDPLPVLAALGCPLAGSRHRAPFAAHKARRRHRCGLAGSGRSAP